MSLLMDALNQAEKAKRQGQATDADANAGGSATTPSMTLELTPLTPSPTESATPKISAPAESPPTLPELPTDLEVLDQEFLAHAAAPKPAPKEIRPPKPLRAETHAAPAPASAPAPAPAAALQATVRSDREAAQNLFTAKQPQPATSKKTFALAVGLLTLVAAIGIGGYFWLQLQPGNGQRPAAPISTAPAAPVRPAPPAEPVPATAAAKPDAPPLPQKAPAPTAVTAAAPVTAEAPPSPIRISTAKLTLHPSLARGYAAYMAGNYAAASSEYRQVLETDARNIDALHGMAALSLRQGHPDSAEEYYLRAIEADPQDALAQAGLIGLKGQANPLQAETRLKILLAAQPDLAFLNVTLGNLYASQNRWNEAQSAFFKAYRADPDNPDMLFNLAVSLDRLHHPKLALQYYLQALAAAANRPASFDKAQVDARLRELQH